jgi:hypothetical protein
MQRQRQSVREQVGWGGLDRVISSLGSGQEMELLEVVDSDDDSAVESDLAVRIVDAHPLASGDLELVWGGQVYLVARAKGPSVAGVVVDGGHHGRAAPIVEFKCHGIDLDRVGDDGSLDIPPGVHSPHMKLC